MADIGVQALGVETAKQALAGEVVSRLDEIGKGFTAPKRAAGRGDAVDEAEALGSANHHAVCQGQHWRIEHHHAAVQLRAKQGGVIMQHTAERMADAPDRLIAALEVMDQLIDQIRPVVIDRKTRVVAMLFQVLHLKIRRQRGDPATALVLIDQISRERLQFPHDLDRADAELRALQVLRVRLFAAHDTGDRDQVHDSIERIARISEGLRTPAGLDYAGGLLICQAYLLAGRPEKSDRALIEQVDLRTDGLLLFLERANEKDPQHQPLQHEAWRLVRRCAPDVYFVLIPADIAGRLVDRGLGPQTVDALLDDYRDARYAEAGQRFDALIAALRAETHPRARQLARRLELLRLYLLAPPGRIERG